MPQNLSVRVHKTITCALTDLVTLTISGDNENRVYLKNLGPGKVSVSFDPTVTATSAGVDCLMLAVGDTLTRFPVYRNQNFTLIADTASTVVSMDVSTK
jgi:hypothetical protein